MRVTTKGALGPGEAVDKLMALRADLPAELELARVTVLKRHEERKKRILERVPADLRGVAEALLKVTEAEPPQTPVVMHPAPRDVDTITAAQEEMPPIGGVEIDRSTGKTRRV